MVAGILNFKTYVIISLLVSGAIFLIGLGFNTQITAALLQLKGSAQAVGMAPVIANVIVDPFRLAFSTGPIGALVAGFLWPISALWLIFVTMLFFFVVLGSGFDQAANSITVNG